MTFLISIPMENKDNNISWEFQRRYIAKSKDNKEIIHIINYLIQVNGHPKAIESTLTAPNIKYIKTPLTNNMN